MWYLLGTIASVLFFKKDFTVSSYVITNPRQKRRKFDKKTSLYPMSCTGCFMYKKLILEITSIFSTIQN